MSNYVSYSISYRDKEFNPQEINNLSHDSAKKQTKMLLEYGVVWLEVYKVTHNYEKIYNYENYKNRPDSITEIIRNRKDLERSTISSKIKEQILSLW